MPCCIRRCYKLPKSSIGLPSEGEAAMSELAIELFVLGLLVGWFVGYMMGWNVGTKDTERRWSEAVSRAKDRGPR